MDGEGGAGWWSGYFDRDFVELYRPFLPEELTRLEVHGVQEALQLPRGARVLDLACGWGRHAVELAAAGLRVTGLDRSEVLLATGRAAPGGARVRWVCGDMRELPFRAEFDAVVSLFSSLGYFGSDEGDEQVLREVRRVLRPGGALLVECMHRDLVAREFLERDWWEGEDGTHVWVEREFDAVEGVSREVLRWRGGAGEREGEKRHEVRVRTATEWARLLRAAGLVPEEWFGSWSLAPFEHTSERLIVLARRDG